ncbi:hypothetical protein PHYBOEH_006648 [Phytophthora boehmeriae]|uniref:MINDY deubiquitinase domain-containing protein n=1 Tax=Phytophthora boehmeriae TaxID=109152 RepID=A0A8T1WGV9_9STRA|nr:hypothetical protein PHYBOEH_006648 [Phytophthora boehmeriae]
MDEAYAVKETQFLGKSVSYVCQNANGPCPLLAIANVLLLRGQLSLEGLVHAPGFVSAHDLMQTVHKRLLGTNPPLVNASELERLTQEKTLKDVEELLPSMLVGLDVNVRFHNITDFEYTVACAVFDMLDIALVHGWLLDQQDDETMKVVGNKSYNELIERLVDYRGVLMTEESNEAATSVPISLQAETSTKEETPSDTPKDQEGREETKSASYLHLPLATHATELQNLSIEVISASTTTVTGAAGSTSIPSPKKSPSQKTVRTMMKERHISDADAVGAATTLLEEGPVLEEFFNSTASQLTYYGLVKLHEGIRERQLCVFFRNNHFSTLFKFEGALYLLVTDAGYLDEPSVVWELLNEIDGDTEYLDAGFRPVTSSQQQENILTQQREQRKQDEQALREAQGLSLTGKTEGSNVTRDAEHTMPAGELFGTAANTDEYSLDSDYILALRFQREEEARMRGEKCVSLRTSPRHLQSIGAGVGRPTHEEAGSYLRANADENDGAERSEQGLSEQSDDRSQEPSENDFVPMTVDGQLVISEEDLEAQRQAELYYQERKRQVDAQTLHCQQQQEQLRLQQQREQQQQQQLGSGLRRRVSEGGDCLIS